MISDLKRLIDQVSREKGIERQTLIATLEEAIKSAIKKKYGNKVDLDVSFNEEYGELEAFQFKEVVAKVADPDKEVAYDDDYRFKPDPVILFEVPRDGAYVFAITDAIYRGREDFVYRISIGELTAYGAAWRRGSNWLCHAHGIPIDYVEDTSPAILTMRQLFPGLNQHRSRRYVCPAVWR